MMKQRKIELLAPAKNLECGIEAVNHGADAVYIGAPKFGARAAAVNSLEDIAASYPIFNYVCRSAVPFFGGSHVGKGYIILFLKIENINLRVLNDDFRHYVIDALSFSHKGSTIHKIIFFSMNYLQNIEYGNTASNEGVL